MKIPRYKAAMRRHKLSRPLTLALQHGKLSTTQTILDYGCGRGGDVERLRATGFNITGYDPHYRPDTPLVPHDVVTCIYVLSCIEQESEREQVLLKVWELAKEQLIVAGLVGEAPPYAQPYRDGTLTEIGTFEKYYKGSEFRAFVRRVLGIHTTCTLASGCLVIPKAQPSDPLWLCGRTRFELVEWEQSFSRFLAKASQEWIPPDDAWLEEYRAGKHYYFRFKSPSASLPGAHKTFHLGKRHSSMHQWGIEALALRDQVALATLRLQKIRELLGMSGVHIKVNTGLNPLKAS
jgi:hypothetical protein